MPSCQNYYYSGQGSIYVAQRNAAGQPLGFRQIGNVPSLELTIDITKFEHKESCSGQRAIDLSIVQEKNGTFSLTMESISAKNLALAAWGTSGLVAGAAVASGTITIDDPDLPYILGDINLDDTVAVTLTNSLSVGSASWLATTAYAVGDAATPVVPNSRFYYVAEGDEGTSGGSEPTWPTTKGDTVVDGTVTWTDGGLIALVEATHFTLDATFGTVTLNALSEASVGDVWNLAYTHLGYVNVTALTETSQERWLRFQGLNTIDNREVVVDLYRASFDPLQGYGLINEEIASIDLSGNILLDALRLSGDQFFRQRYLNTAAFI